MPITKSAKKALRQTQKRAAANKTKRAALKAEIKDLRLKKSPEILKKIYSLADKLAKRGIIHKNKAKRIKSRAARML